MIIFKEEEYIFDEYKDKIDSIIQKLISEKIEKVGVICRRTPELLYLLKSLFDFGITFVPITPDYPPERRDYILEKAEIRYIITDKELEKQFSSYSLMFLNEIEIVKNYTAISNFKNQDDNCSYILFTSGTTGKPKGVEISKRALKRFFEGISLAIDFNKGKRIACLTTVMFDIFILESIFALEKGLDIVLACESEQNNPRTISELITKNEVDILQITPSRLQMLLNCDENLSCLSDVKLLMVGGEPLSKRLLGKLQKAGNFELYNMYGPTEATVWCAVSNLKNKNEVDIGKPLSTMNMYILDDNMNQVENGEAGEIYLAGDSLAIGYVREPDLTDSKFIIWEKESQQERIYKTGDLGCFLQDGSIKYLGRVDNQVKIHGYRVELEEIESCINAFDGIEQSIAFYDSENKSGLVLFYTSDCAVEIEKVHFFLSHRLPKYMIPSIFYKVKEFYYTNNGKIDRKRVWECEVIDEFFWTNSESDSGEITETHIKVKKAIEGFLKTKSNVIMDYNTNLEQIGIDSLTFIKLIVYLEDMFEFRFDDEKLVLNAFASIFEIGEYISQKVK